MTILNFLIRYWPHAIRGEHDILQHMFNWIYAKPDFDFGKRLLALYPTGQLMLVEIYASLIGNPSAN